jgi:hypothetical protein
MRFVDVHGLQYLPGKTQGFAIGFEGTLPVWQVSGKSGYFVFLGVSDWEAVVSVEHVACATKR